MRKSVNQTTPANNTSRLVQRKVTIATNRTTAEPKTVDENEDDERMQTEYGDVEIGPPSPTNSVGRQTDSVTRVSSRHAKQIFK